MDEHRIGLKPILRRVWARRGRRPVTMVRPRYQWLWVYAFARPATGETWWLVLPRVNTEAMTTALAEFATAVGAGPEKRVVLVLDRAGWHLSGKVVVPEGITRVFLPARSPELQPAERRWGQVDCTVANRVWETLDGLAAAVVQRCRVLREQRERLRSMLGFHWWPRFA
jgi:hypothetical protein